MQLSVFAVAGDSVRDSWPRGGAHGQHTWSSGLAV
jgi:hypothetical protein